MQNYLDFYKIKPAMRGEEWSGKFVSFTREQLDGIYQVNKFFKNFIKDQQLRSILPIGRGMLHTGHILVKQKFVDTRTIGKVDLTLVTTGNGRTKL